MAGTALSYTAAVRLLRKGELPICLFLYGPEDYLKEDLVRKAADATLSPGLRSFNLSTFDLAESSLADALSATEAFPAMGGARVVVVRNADRLKRAKKQVELLRSRLSNPPPYLCFLLVASDPDPSAAFLKSLPESLHRVALKSPSEREIDKWLSAKAADLGMVMGAETRRLFVEMVGRSLWRVSNEFAKLCINAGDRKEINRDDVLALVGGAPERSPFALADAITRRDREGAAVVAADLLNRGEAPVAMTGLLTWNLVRRWGSAAERGPAGVSRLREFRRKAVLLCETDNALKRSKLESALAAQLLVDALTRPGD